MCQAFNLMLFSPLYRKVNRESRLKRSLVPPLVTQTVSPTGREYGPEMEWLGDKARFYPSSPFIIATNKNMLLF